MDVILITTTIYVPEVMRYYRKLDSDALFIVAGDRKSPHDEIRTLMKDIGNAIYLSDSDQEKLGYECSEIIGWNCTTRRNIALLEAIKRNPDVIITIDDDNLPISADYFEQWRNVFNKSFGIEVATSNIGSLFHKQFDHRGTFQERSYHVGYAHNAKVGLAEGVCLGDTDTNAANWLVDPPQVTTVPELLREGVFVGFDSLSAINSQNTAFRTEIAPLMPVLPGTGRAEDIWGFLIAQRIMWDLGYQVMFGPPFVWQSRHEHDIVRDLEQEILCMKYTQGLCNALADVRVLGKTMLEKMSYMYDYLAMLPYIPERTIKFGRAWIEDVENVY